MPLRVFALVLLGLAVFGLPANAQDRHAGYYYPDPQTTEIYTARVQAVPEATKIARVSFAIGIAGQQSKLGFAPPYHMFVKGAQAEKLIIVATEDGRYNTLFRLRALLAALTAYARGSTMFAEVLNPEDLTFLDFLKMAGFEQLTVSDGDTISHQIVIE